MLDNHYICIFGILFDSETLVGRRQIKGTKLSSTGHEEEERNQVISEELIEAQEKTHDVIIRYHRMLVAELK